MYDGPSIFGQPAPRGAGLFGQPTLGQGSQRTSTGQVAGTHPYQDFNHTIGASGMTYSQPMLDYAKQMLGTPGLSPQEVQHYQGTLAAGGSDPSAYHQFLAKNGMTPQPGKPITIK